MNKASDYIAYIRSLLIIESPIIKFNIVREEAQNKIGLYRYRLLLANGDFLEAFERFAVEDGQIKVTKYSFQWQDSSGALKKRWDNASHHPEIETYPAHVHEGDDDIVLPHPPVTIIDILKVICDDKA